MMHVDLKSFKQEKEDDDGNKVEVDLCGRTTNIFRYAGRAVQMD